VVPPLIWGWLTYRVMTFDVLGDHASTEERRQILREHRWPLFGIGIVTGYIGAAPSLLWAFSATALILAPLLIVVAVWMYTLVFAFSGLWFAHYALAALHRLRQSTSVAAPVPAPVVDLSL
jgi:cobalamin synthase